HNHQPIGNFDHVLVEATERAYHPFLERLHARPEVRLVVHCTGSLLEWLRERAPRTFDLLAALAGGGQVELLTGGFYEPILAVRRGRVPAVTMVDDGEKFGVWPGTHAHVYEKGWLDRFFDRLLATEWLDLVTLSDIVDRVEATDRVYLPTASYREMGEWVLPP